MNTKGDMGGENILSEYIRHLNKYKINSENNPELMKHDEGNWIKVILMSRWHQ